MLEGVNILADAVKYEGSCSAVGINRQGRNAFIDDCRGCGKRSVGDSDRQ